MTKRELTEAALALLEDAAALDDAEAGEVCDLLRRLSLAAETRCQAVRLRLAGRVAEAQELEREAEREAGYARLLSDPEYYVSDEYLDTLQRRPTEEAS